MTPSPPRAPISRRFRTAYALEIMLEESQRGWRDPELIPLFAEMEASTPRMETRVAGRCVHAGISGEHAPRTEPVIVMQAMNTSHRGRPAALDYEERASYIFELVVKLATNPACIRTRQRRVQISTRRSGSLECCWTALIIVPADARLGKSAGALVLATECRGREEMVP